MSHYRPLRHLLVATLAAAGVHLDDVKAVVKSHLHFDHYGGNPELVDRTIFAQRVELETVRSTEHYNPPSAHGLRLYILLRDELNPRVFRRRGLR
jgi:N-acyl homoserine lactone hydrolase